MEHKELLETIKGYHRDTDENVIGVGYGYKTVNGIITEDLSIIFIVKEKLPKENLTQEQLLPKEITIQDQVYPTDVVQCKFKLLGVSDCDPSFYTWRTSPPANRNEQRPLQGGISIGNYTNTGINSSGYPMKDYVGTMGLLANDNETGALVGLTNNHVVIFDAFICSERTLSGTNSTIVNNIKGNIVTQPNEFSQYGLTYSIGTVKKYYPLRLPGAYPFIYNDIDAAMFTIDAVNVSSSISFHQLNLVNSSYPWASTSEIDNLLVTNPLLYSTGRTTGAKGEGVTKLRPTQFTIVAVDYNLQGTSTTVYYQDVIMFVATLTVSGPITDTCYDPISGGDSGSALIADFAGIKKVIGLVFAGAEDGTGKTIYGVACRIDKVATLLNVSAWNGESINYSNVTGTLELDINGRDNREYIDHTDGHRYWQVGLKNI